MKNEFVPYELAVKLKALGFDEHELCFAHWIERDERDGGGVKLEMWNDEDTYYEVKSLIKAPTFSQAFRFFRKKYKLSGLIEIGTHKYSFIIFDEAKDSRKITSSMNGTPEEAELACLQKLIKIVETNS